jgi:hypothetical protein
MLADTVRCIDWQPGRIRWLLPLLTYAVALWGAWELMLQQRWSGWWLALVVFLACGDARRLQREVRTRHHLRLEAGTIDIDDATVTVERAWLAPFGTALWLRRNDRGDRLLMIYPGEMSRAGYAALRRHLKLWVGAA